MAAHITHAAASKAIIFGHRGGPTRHGGLDAAAICVTAQFRRCRPLPHLRRRHCHRRLAYTLVAAAAADGNLGRPEVETGGLASTLVDAPATAVADTDADEDDEPPISASAAKANALVEDAMLIAAAESPALAAPAAPNAYLPLSPGFSLPLPPDPVRFPRAPLNLKLAVLLLRSTYETVDAMNIIPMDQFQIKFWKSRQAEWEPYTYQYAPLKIEQGRLTDPLYFDFISYIQFQSVARELPGSSKVFEERSGAEGTVRVVRRNPALDDNKILPAVLAQRLGDLIYARLRFGFEDQEFGAPEPCDPTADLDSVVEGMRKLVDALVSKGYALRGNVVGGGGGTTAAPSGGGVGEAGVGGAGKPSSRKVTVRLAGPATLWAAQALAAKGINPPNEYLGYCLTAFCRASGVRSVYSSKVSDTSVDLEFTISRL